MNKLSSKCMFFPVMVFALVMLLPSNNLRGQEYHGGTTMPTYKGGNKGLKEVITKNLNFPDSIKKVGIYGTVMVNLSINKDGKVENIKLIRGIHPVCDAEAIRVARLLVDWQPANNWSKLVGCNVLLPIVFPGEKTTGKGPVIVSGTISEIYTGKPIEGAFLYVIGTNIGTITDAKGNYKIELNSDDYEMEVSFVGYSPKTEHIGRNRTINVELEKGYYFLDYTSGN